MRPSGRPKARSPAPRRRWAEAPAHAAPDRGRLRARYTELECHAAGIRRQRKRGLRPDLQTRGRGCLFQRCAAVDGV
jgi:hypothetical protein